MVKSEIYIDGELHYLMQIETVEKQWEMNFESVTICGIARNIYRERIAMRNSLQKLTYNSLAAPNHLRILIGGGGWLLEVDIKNHR